MTSLNIEKEEHGEPQLLLQKMDWRTLWQEVHYRLNTELRTGYIYIYMLLKLTQDRQCTYNLILKHCVAVQKQEVLRILSVSVTKMHGACVILSSVAFPAARYLSNLSHKQHEFLKR